MTKEEKLKELKEELAYKLLELEGRHLLGYWEDMKFEYMEHANRLLPIIQKYCLLRAEGELKNDTRTRQCFEKKEHHAFDTGYFTAKQDMTTVYQDWDIQNLGAVTE